jgi:hypothetical protein
MPIVNGSGYRLFVVRTLRGGHLPFIICDLQAVPAAGGVQEGFGEGGVTVLAVGVTAGVSVIGLTSIYSVLQACTVYY